MANRTSTVFGFEISSTHVLEFRSRIRFFFSFFIEGNTKIKRNTRIRRQFFGEKLTRPRNDGDRLIQLGNTLTCLRFYNFLDNFTRVRLNDSFSVNGDIKLGF